MKLGTSALVLIASVGVLLRVLMGFTPYSGESTPPVFGDYEAQRHWMEITINRPISEWYIDSELHDSNYWRLDYPPLSAIHEYAMGRVSEYFEPESVTWIKSRGYESLTHRLFMRMSVLISDVLVYFTSAFFLAMAPIFTDESSRQLCFGLLILNPVLIYVDHGHFQYNCVALGLLIWSIGFYLRRRTFLSAVAYTLSFLFKQTLAYFAPVFLAVMLGEALQLRGKFQPILRITGLGLVVLSTIGLTLLPFVYECTSMNCATDQLGSILRRVFPLHRTIFEDYVANFWIVASPIFRLRDASLHTLAICGYISLLATIGGFVECFWVLLRNPDRRVLLLALPCTSMSFYLFSWMVHEKAIALPVTALICATPVLLEYGNMWILSRIFEAAILSMWQLIRIEGSECSAIAIGGIGMIVFTLAETLAPQYEAKKRNPANMVAKVCNSLALVFSVMQSSTVVPSKHPFIWVLATSVACFGTFFLVWRQLVCVIRCVIVSDSRSARKQS